MDLESTNTQISQVDEKREFFRSAGYGNHYELLIYLFNIDNKYHIYIGSLLKFFASSHVHELLSLWSDESEEAAIFLKFSEFLIDERVCFKYPEFIDASPIKDQLKGSLERLYLLALVIERLPLTDKPGKDWHLTLTTWLVIRAIEYAREGHYDDVYLIDVITRLRMAADENPEALEIIQSLKLPNHQTYYFSEIETRLTNQPHTELRREGIRVVISKFLNSAIKVAIQERKAANKNNYPRLSNLPRFSVCLSDENDNNFDEGLLEPLDGDDELQPISNGNNADDEDLDFIYPTIRQADTDLKKIVSDQSVLLTSTINAQFGLFDPHILTDFEINSLNEFIIQKLKSNDESVRTLSAITYIAIRISRTLDRALNTPISTATEAQWAINPFDSNLYRLPPRRKSDWKPNAIQKSWLNNSAQFIKIKLPESVQKIIEERIKKNKLAKNLNDLWSITWPTTSELFDKLFSSFRHVSPAGLANIYPTTFVRFFPDEPVTHLISSHPQSALPASCAYANFRVGDVAKLNAQSFKFELPTVADDISNITPSTILFGSALDISEDLLIEAIEEMNLNYLSITQSENISFIKKHNALATYIVYMLYASTGARPIKDPFESLYHFDFENALVYIDDKAIDSDSTGRVVALPKSLCAFIRDVYLRHLRLLASALWEKSQQLSYEILQIAAEKPTGMMPFFFFIDDTAKTPEWASIHPSSLTNIDLFNTPLPENLFRHRFAKKMREGRVDPEIVAGLMGHVDFGCAPYGYFSHRCFIDDMQVARPVIDQIFKDLPFNFSQDFHSIPNLKVKSNHIVRGDADLNDSHIPFYGKEARKLAREKRHKAWSDAAAKDIESAITDLGTTFETLNEAHINELVKKMLFRPNGLPRTNRAFRYDYLLKTLEQESRKNKNAYQHNKRYVIYRPESIFDESAMYALGNFKKIKKALKADSQVKCISRLNKRAGLQLIPILLMIETRLCDLSQIQAVLKENQFFIIDTEDGYYLEISNISQHNSTHPVRPYKISPQCAYLIDKNKIQLNDDAMSQVLDDTLKPIFTNISHLNFDSYGDFLNSLSNLVHQANCLQLTGIEAGYLSGKLESYGLLRADWVYLRFGKRLDFNDKVESEANLDLLQGQIATTTVSDYRFEDAKTFLDSLRKTIDTDYPASQSAGRTALTNQIKILIKEHESRISSSIIIFAQWIIQLIKKGPRIKNLKPSSVLTYFDTLCKPLLDHLYDQDLYLFDEDDMTEAYTNIIKASKLKNQGYLSNRILEFHRYASEIGIDDPDWTEVPLVNLGTKVSPGFIHEKEYIATLKSLYNDRNSIYGKSLQPCMLLIFAMRFGLRANEALGLLKDDWYLIDGQLWVDVKPNYVRSLKSRLSKRKVPLLFKLSKIEETIINKFMAEFEANHQSKSNIPLFNIDQKPLSKSQNKVLRAFVNFKLKQVTGLSHLSLHDARHTAANHFSLSLFDLKLKGWKEVTMLSNTRTTFLGNNRVSKKLSWLSARYLGHSILETQYKNYLHYLPELVERRFESIFSGSEKYKFTSERVIDLDKLAQAKMPDLGLLEFVSPQPTELTPETILTVFKLIGLGRPAEYIAEKMNIDLVKIQRIFNLINEHLIHAKVNNLTVDANSFFRSLTQMGWKTVTKQINPRILDDTFKQNLIKNRQMYLLQSHESSDVHIKMIGPTRQIILISDESFRVFKLMMDFFGLTQNDFGVYINESSNLKYKDKLFEIEIKRIEKCLSDIQLVDVFRKDIKNENFVQNLPNQQRTKAIQLDSIAVKGTYNSIRANIVAQTHTKNSKTSMELITMLLTTIVYMDLTY